MYYMVNIYNSFSSENNLLHVKHTEHLGPSVKHTEHLGSSVKYVFLAPNINTAVLPLIHRHAVMPPVVLSV